jgi:hypothetical protein
VTAPAQRAPRLSPWGRLVAASAALIAGAALVLVAWGAASGHERRVSYSVRGMLNGVVLDVGDADVRIVGGGRHPAVELTSTERYSFGHRVRRERSASGGVFRLRSRCPRTALAGSCTDAYRLVVPDNVPLTVATAGGDVAFRDYRGSARVRTDSGAVSIESFCGFMLDVRSETGRIDADAACAPQRLSLRTTSGAIAATVPPGRYRVDADSSAGEVAVRGLRSAPDAPFEVQALSTSGDVSVGARE